MPPRASITRWKCSGRQQVLVKHCAFLFAIVRPSVFRARASIFPSFVCVTRVSGMYAPQNVRSSDFNCSVWRLYGVELAASSVCCTYRHTIYAQGEFCLCVCVCAWFWRVFAWKPRECVYLDFMCLPIEPSAIFQFKLNRLRASPPPSSVWESRSPHRLNWCAAFGGENESAHFI